MAPYKKKILVSCGWLFLGGAVQVFWIILKLLRKLKVEGQKF